MSSDFNYNFGFVAEEIFGLFRVFDICPEMRSVSKECAAFVVVEFSWRWHTTKTSTHPRLFKKLDTRQ